MTVSSNSSTLPRREFGKTGVQLSIIGLGGVALWDVPQDHANRMVAEFVERGVNYFDVAPTYGDAQDKLGPALEPYRKNVFLACKSGKHTAGEVEAELKNSLKVLRTDYFDLYQLHGMTDVVTDVDAAFAKGGPMEYLIEAKKSGVIRHLGFSAHSVAAALAAMDRFPFDSVLFPVNFVTYYAGKFGPQIMEKAQACGVARLAIKAMALRRWPENSPERSKYPKCWYQPLTDPREAELALRFTLSQPITAALPPGNEALFRLALDWAPRFTPVAAAELQELEALAATVEPIFRA